MARILIADDSPLFRKAYEKMLTSAGYTVYTVEDGFECLTVASELQPDLILMDVVMPNMNGFQATRKLSRDPLTSHIPIVVSSTKDTEPDALWAKRQGATDYLVKPAKESDLLETVSRVLNNAAKTGAKPKTSKKVQLDASMAEVVQKVVGNKMHLNQHYKDYAVA